MFKKNVKILPMQVIDNKLTDSIFFEFTQLLLEPKANRDWLQKVASLLKQFVKAEYVLINSFVDNYQAISLDQINKNINIKFPYGSEHEFWEDDFFYVPLSVDGFLVMAWKDKSEKEKVHNLENIIDLLKISMKNRSNQISLKKKDCLNESLITVENTLNGDLELKDQMLKIANDVVKSLNVSRCQIKIFSNVDIIGKSLPDFNSDLSVECVKDGYMEAISVIPKAENDWIVDLCSGKKTKLEVLLSSNENYLYDILSVKSIYGSPVIFKGKPIGVIIVHQCDCPRLWNEDEKLYLSHISSFLGILFGKTNEHKNTSTGDTFSSGFNVLNSDDFLRELGHMQVDSNVRNQPFSLLMIDIEKLKDVNLSMGFVAGNLVLSHTARCLSRYYGDKYKIARYSSDEYVVLMAGINQSQARLETESLKEKLSNVSVLGVGTVDYNFSFVTYPSHSENIAGLLSLLEEGMILSKSRGKFQIAGVDEIQGQSKGRWEQLVSNAIPDIILKKSSFKTGPEVIESINVHLSKQKDIYSADILDSVQSLALALDAKDSYTEGHSKRVSEYAYILAKELGLGLQEIEWVRLAAALHDIGKIGIPENILCKPAKLTSEEYEVMKKHPVIGARILKPIKPLEEVASLVLYHHEHWDGSGYPHGLKGEDIPVGARIVSIVDAYQAMTSNRPYRSTLPQDEAIKRLREGVGKQWEPDLIERFISIIA